MNRRKRSAAKLALFTGVLVALVAVAAPLAVAGGVRSSARTEATGARACHATVKTSAQQRYVINRYAQERMGFAPGTVTVTSGCELTFEFAAPRETDPHSLSIVNRSDLPRSAAQMENCKICGRIAAKHIEHPGRPPGPNNPILHWVVNVGSPGLDQPGDSIGIFEAKGSPPGHKSVTVPVSAPAGTTLYFMCGVHPWMQGKIVVR